MSPTTPEGPTRIRVWDAPVRIFHWLLVPLIATSWWTADIGRLDYHRYAGYTLLGLLIFRIYWGFAGGTTARFSNFLKSPAAVRSYLRSALQRASGPATHPFVGHNPAGGWSVLLMLGLLSVQVGLGLVAVDIDGIESGPLSHLVSFDTGRSCAELHELVFNTLLAVIALHVGAVLFYFWYRRENLIAPMITGTRAHSTRADATAADQGSISRAIIGLLLASFVVWVLAGGVVL